MSEPTHPERERLVRAHLRAGWYGLACFIALGILLEAFLAFELRGYVDVEAQERRLLLRLAHAHGTLLSLLQLGFAFTLDWLNPRGTQGDPDRQGGRDRQGDPDTQAAPGRALRVASLGLGMGLGLVPLGFLLGGIQAGSGDPGPGILLVPVGAAALLVGVVAAALSVGRSGEKVP
ncbi:MAG TPA: hypothetical protein VLC09_04440 [Polyangiaceae bacterium]|nr:hypothetical protein [Polyangiaceae bacterium]